MIKIPASIQKILNFDEEKENKYLIDYATTHNIVFIAMIAPYVGLKVSPVSELSAEIGLSEEFGIEVALEHIKKETGSKKLILLVGSPGGLVSSSYKVALALRDYFDDIKVFVPHIAASGGTLVAMTGNEIVMGTMSNLTPLDIQIVYDGKQISCQSMFRSFGRLSKFFEDKLPEEAPYPWKALADKLNPVVMEEWDGFLTVMENYLYNILTKTDYNEDTASEITQKWVRGFYTHTQVLDYQTCKEHKLKVVESSKYPDLWQAMKEWLSEYMLKSTDKHFIRYIVPKKQKVLKPEDYPLNKEKEVVKDG